jgi:hypothetical protein
MSGEPSQEQRPTDEEILQHEQRVKDEEAQKVNEQRAERR